MSRTPISRRDFLKQSGALVAGTLLIAYGGPLLKLGPHEAEAQALGTAHFGDFISIAPDGQVTLVCHRSEMGQHTRSAMTMLIAEELDIDWETVAIVQADGDPRYGDQNTDGSKSVRDNYLRLRTAGAAARAMLVQAAAQQWGVDPVHLRTRSGRVYHEASARSLGYGELVPAAAQLPLPQTPTLKASSDFTIIGTPKPSPDLDAILDGSAVYGQDVRLDGMLYASIERAPNVKAKVKRLDTTKALAVPGVVKVVRLERFGDPALTNEAVAVVATNTWAALQGRKALAIEWEQPKLKGSSELRAELDAALRRPGKVFRNDGDVDRAKRSAARTLEAEYHTPYLVQAPMEPPACTARFDGDRCEIWAPVQDPQRARKAVADFLRVPVERVTMHVTLLGGGFGRKSQPDFIVEAAGVARQLDRPVKVVWSREDEIRHGFYHAECKQSLSATLDAAGTITGWHHRSAFPSIVSLFAPGLLSPIVKGPDAFEMAMGASNLPYVIPNVRCEGATVDSEIRIGWLRSVCNMFHAFGVNSFLDEVAHATGRDPVAMRLDLLKGEPIPEREQSQRYPMDRRRLARVIEVTANEGGWGKPQPDGTGLGFAAHYSFLSYVAALVEVAVEDGAVVVKRVHCALDCGTVVNPDTVRAQMEGAVVFGLSAALNGEVTVANGQVEQSNFHDYPVLRLSETPEIHVHLIPSDAPPTGVGEPGVPPVIPALTNAIFAATGQRVRALPISKHLEL